MQATDAFHAASWKTVGGAMKRRKTWRARGTDAKTAQSNRSGAANAAKAHNAAEQRHRLANKSCSNPECVQMKRAVKRELLLEFLWEWEWWLT